MNEELLPCPFCGEPANLCKQRFVSYDGSIHRCYWHVIHRCRHGNYTETKLCGTKAEARAAWNRREDISATLGRGTCRLKHAQWDDGTCTWGCICTACDAHLEHETGIGYNYCPHCGRKVVDA